MLGSSAVMFGFRSDWSYLKRRLTPTSKGCKRLQQLKIGSANLVSKVFNVVHQRLHIPTAAGISLSRSHSSSVPLLSSALGLLKRAGHFAPLQTIPHHHWQLTQNPSKLSDRRTALPLNTAEDHNYPKLQEADKFLSI